MKEEFRANNKKDYDELMLSGHKKLNPCCCFEPKVLDAYNDYTKAADGYYGLELYEDYIKAMIKRAECNHQMRIHFDEGMIHQKIANVYWNKLHNANSCIAYMKMSSRAFQRGGKLMDSIVIFNTFCRELIPKKEFNLCNELIVFAFDAGINYFQEELVQIAMGDTNTLLIDITSELALFEIAIRETMRYIEAKKQSKLSKNNIFRSYIILGILRIIVKDIHLADELIHDMYKYNDNNQENINDYIKLINSFKNNDKKAFNFCVNYSFSLLPNGLLKALRKAFEANKYDSYISTDSNEFIDSMSGCKNHTISLPATLNDKKLNHRIDSLFGETHFR